MGWMMNKKVVPFDQEEEKLISTIENEKWVPVKNQQELKSKLKQAARNTILREKRVNLRMTEKDIYMMKVKALEEGIPYQTLMSSILHKFLNGRLREVNS